MSLNTHTRRTHSLSPRPSSLVRRRVAQWLALGLSATMVAVGLESFGLASTTRATGTPVFIDAGGSGVHATDGTTWSGDWGFSGGRASGTKHTVLGLTDERVTRSIRVGMSGYHIGVSNGHYKVTLQMVETYWKAAGKRIFSAKAEGVTLFTNLDLFAAVGRNRELDRSATVTVTDSQLDIAFIARSDLALVSGISIVPVGAAPPGTPTAAVNPRSTATPSTAPAPDSLGPADADPSSLGTPSATPSSTPTATRTTNPPPSSVPAGSDKPLSFSPPSLDNPVVMPYPGGAATLNLDVTRDYVITLPTDRALVNTKGIQITGGHNVVLIGGAVDVRDGDLGRRRGMYLSKATPNGTTFIEGVRLLSSTQGSLTEGIDLASPGARVVLQNVAIDGQLSGSYSTNHADAIQAWAGPAVLNIDGFTASTGYQGFFLLPNQHASERVSDWDLRRVSLTGNNSGYLAWRDSGSYAIHVSDFYASGSHMSNGGFWPNTAAWQGAVHGSAPADFAASAGPGYTSPGYR